MAETLLLGRLDSRSERRRMAAKRRLQFDPLLVGEPFDVIETAPADDANPVLRHGRSYTRRKKNERGNSVFIRAFANVWKVSSILQHRPNKGVSLAFPLQSGCWPMPTEQPRVWRKRHDAADGRFEVVRIRIWKISPAYRASND